MKLFLYNLILILLTPMFGFRIFYKSIYDKDYRSNFLQRFGISKQTHNFASDKKIIWFHAVSLGEVIGSQNIIKNLTNEANIILTVTTPTGLRKAKELYKDHDIQISYAAWDFYLFVLHFINKNQPNLIIIFETEVWPSMINIAFDKDIPVVMSNGRMSEKSYNAYKRFSFFSEEAFRKLTLVLAQSSSHESRFKDLGVKSESLKVSGSVKYDLEPLKSLESPHIQTFINNQFILASSTHNGEDEIILKAFIEVSKDLPKLKLVIVPRHPDRAEEISNIAAKKNISACIESKGININSSVMIIDSIGKTSLLYKNAAAAFVGGSLVKRGGHNIIEPAFFECPIIIGPHMFNFESIAEEFLKTGSCRSVYDYKSLAKEFISILDDDKSTLSMTQSATMLILKNSGASAYQLSAIIHELNGVNK